MTYYQLTGGAYQSRTLVSASQRSLNLYLEKAPAETGEPSISAHNVTPGTVRLSVAPQERIRGLYRATSGKLFGVAGQDLYYIDPSWVWNHIGHIQPSTPVDAVPRTNPVSICDNGTDGILVDGTQEGWHWNIQTNDGFARITDDGFYGSKLVSYLDTFFLLSKPDTPIWYVSGSIATTFDPLDFASKSGLGDNVVAVVPLHRALFVMGVVSTEIWYNSGGGGSGSLANNTFPFDITPSFHAVGVAAVYSIASTADKLFWLGQDASGNCQVMVASGTEVGRISTHSIEAEFSTYTRLDDAVGFTYQQQGHTFYQLSFTEADKTWCFDLITGQWHERCWLDADGHEHRHRGNLGAFAYNTIVIGDWETADLYKYDLTTFTDAIPGGTGNGPIKRLRSFPHIIDQTMNRRVFYRTLIANMAVGTSSNVQTAETVVNTSFNGTDGTLLEDYSNVADVNGRFVKVSDDEGQVVNDGFVALGNSGSPIYRTSVSPSSPNYAVSFTAGLTMTGIPTPGSILWVLGRGNIDTDQSGYQASVMSDGVNFTLALAVAPSAPVDSSPLGAMTGSFAITLEMLADRIAVYAQRSTDNLWLNMNNLWVALKAPAISISDTTYRTAGNVYFGGTWAAPLPE